ncbi:MULTISPECIES: YdbL family protein [unclassified Lentimonas]|uniref:YdbL family protein n=1 Tax=unclassified Lentimonas TaxID=2630993 RepID=UPI00132A3281|nr:MULTISPECIES: DUF1318 domain-containing protein [unclassified Lentimonas]CAA6689912.1 Unannotated [Lentimonas sp. CC10]CAA6690954.1 Unannotated [Lentimonas sp. CC19]CAA7069396.1 Unannotated [Lentimonas sp. CC11]
MKHLRFTFLLLIAFACSLATGYAQQSDENAIKERIIERVPSLDALKLSGKVGENNLGFVEQRARLNKTEDAIVEQENTDRRALYAIIAKRLGIQISVVGKGRASELRENSAKGVWLQSATGDWYQK